MDLTFIIIISVVLVIAGFILALLIIPLLGLDHKSSGQSAKQDGSPKETSTTTTLHYPARTVHVWRDPQKDTLSIEIDGQITDSASNLSLEQRQFLTRTATELVEWMGKAEFETRPPSSPEKPPQPPLPIGNIPIQTETKPADRGMVNSFLKTLQPGNLKSNQQPKSLAAQVDDILQEKLAYAGLSHHTVHLTDMPNYGLAVQVDRDLFESIDSVPDEAIKNLIREAVAEWQKRGSLGGI